MQLGKYLKTAFTNRWNLLFFLGGLGFAIVSRRADVVAPLVVAGEALYVGLLGTHPKFQRYVDAQEAKALRKEAGVDTQESLRHVLGALPQKALARFDALRSRCIELRQLALELKDPGSAGTPPALDSLQLQGLDRLLWIFLRLLFTKHSLDRFLERTSDVDIRKEIDRLQAHLVQVPADSKDAQDEKVRKALEDNIETCKLRLTNYEKARDNCELVGLEIDRLENKIRSLSELAVNRHEPDFISGQVDQVASSMLHTEKTMNELEFATGIDFAEQAVPELLSRTAAKETQ